MSYYCGIADVHGLESFIPYAERVAEAVFEGGDGRKTLNNILFTLKLRAMANRHRHTVVYKVRISDRKAEEIEKLLEEGKYEEALNVLKTVPDIEIMKEHGMAKSWGMIPNPTLDPYTD